MAYCSPGWPQAHNEAEDGFELLTFLPAPSKWWDCSYTSPFPVYLIPLKTNPEVRLLDQIGLFLYRQVIKAIGKNLTEHLALPTHILRHKSLSHSSFICLEMAPFPQMNPVTFHLYLFIHLCFYRVIYIYAHKTYIHIYDYICICFVLRQGHTV